MFPVCINPVCSLCSLQCIPNFFPCVSRLFLVFRVCNLWKATSCRANITYTETVSIVYSVPSSQCGPNCVRCSLYILQFSWCSRCATYLCVPYCLLCSQFPVCAPCCTVPHFPIMFSVCFECVPSVIHTIRCVPSVYIPCVFPWFPSVFPNSPTSAFLTFPPVFSDCSLCYKCVTCGRPPAVGPTLPTQKQSVLFTRFPVPCVFQIVCYLCAPYCLLGSQFPVCSQMCPVPNFPLLFSVCF